MSNNPIIVGIGASAGGLEALEDFFQNVPKNSGLAFVVIQHLAPNRTDLMPELLQRITPMHVQQAGDNMNVKANCIYIIPPNKDLSILHGALYLIDPVEPKGLRLPINFFFHSLAADQDQHAVAVILSGMGSDGTIGLRAIKENAGLVAVQLPESAKYDSMPQSAINAGLVDIIAPATQLATRIIAALNHVELDTNLTEKVTVRSSQQTDFEHIILLLRDHTGNDFSFYKKTTLYRRIDRRMAVHQIKDMSRYVHYLRENPQEVELLFKELLIGVTHFFRDPIRWEMLKQLLPDLIAAYPGGKEFRAWVPACSTGEEAYSLAITFQEVLDDLQPEGKFALQIFATDIDDDAIAQARQGYYSKQIEENVSGELLSRYFSKDPIGYKINKSIRDWVIFAKQNVIMDPPFTKLDIITCRNLLIYLDTELQKKLIALFHYALTNRGVLLLGNAETIGSYTHLFSAIDPASNIYQRIDTPLLYADLDFPVHAFPASTINQNNLVSEIDMNTSAENLQTMADQLLLRQFSSPAVLINEEGDILYINGRTGKYLEPAAGKANWNIYAMAHESLRYDIERAIKKAKGQPEPVFVKASLHVTHQKTQHLNLVAQEITTPELLRGTVIIVFNEIGAPVKQVRKQSATTSSSENSLLEELQQARTTIQSMREQMQVSREELKSANEELQSTNEELQSANEELTTSKEEMQSLNEELQTVNGELQTKVDDMSLMNDDMSNLLNSTEIAILFLDEQLHVRRFTPYCIPLFKLIDTDTGRPLSDIVTDLDYPQLQADAAEVLRSLVFSEKQVMTQSAHWYKVRIMPYRTQENKIDGVVITFTDIHQSKLLEFRLRETQAPIT